MPEEVLCIPASAAGPLPAFSPPPDGAWLATVLESSTFLQRTAAENDPNYRQIIPYALLRHGAFVFRYRRTVAGQDPRLHNKYSLGVGGHINRRDDLPFTHPGH